MIRRKQFRGMSGSGRHCAVRGCHWTQKKLKELLLQPCFEHPHQLREHCPCPKPFAFHAPRDDDERREWYAALRRKNPPSRFFVCSFHFIDKKPTEQNPLPQLYLGFEQDVNTISGTGCHKRKMHSSSKALLERTIVEVTVKATDLENSAEKMHGCEDGALEVHGRILSDSPNSGSRETIHEMEAESATSENRRLQVDCTLNDNRQDVNLDCSSRVDLCGDIDTETDRMFITTNHCHHEQPANNENLHNCIVDCTTSEHVCLDAACESAKTGSPLRLNDGPRDVHCHNVGSVPRESMIPLDMNCASHLQAAEMPGTAHEKSSLGEMPERVPKMFDASTQWTDFSQQDHSYTKLGNQHAGDGRGTALCKVCSKGTSTDKVLCADAGMQCDGEDTYRRVITNESDALLYAGTSVSALESLINHLAPCKKSGFVKLSVEDQILMTLMKLKLNLLLADLARRFHISESLVSRTVTFWRGVMSSQLSQVSAWLPPEIIQRITSMQSASSHTPTVCSDHTAPYDE